MKKTGTGNQKQESIFEDYVPIYADMTYIQVEQCLRQRVQTALNNLYGPEPDSKIQIRLKEEWSAIKRVGIIPDIAFGDEFCSWMKAKRHPYQVLPGGSLILFLLGITQGNPLQPHYHCKDCHRTEWVNAPDGYDLSIPDLSFLLDDVQDHRACPCGSMDVMGDGHDIPWGTVFGMSEIYEPCLHINLPESMQDEFPLFIERHWVATDCNAVLLYRIDHKTPVFHFLHMSCSFVFQGNYSGPPVPEALPTGPRLTGESQ